MYIIGIYDLCLVRGLILLFMYHHLHVYFIIFVMYVPVVFVCLPILYIL